MSGLHMLLALEVGLETARNRANLLGCTSTLVLLSDLLELEQICLCFVLTEPVWAADTHTSAVSIAT
eukprot:CAMPEP_0115529260 /NCGR_PEP_ID=MMETSP0271-20121206/83843_1 /TAXON_ID=71861 /ORGANISM="Scrippsiella trochoidea, Strain CCMP3099" /LENGTH=66 /DNA_ID=CAMNT_0002961263 /DNA_START=1 /DNA_END=201 /DNA_ORIENTATION=+